MERVCVGAKEQAQRIASQAPSRTRPRPSDPTHAYGHIRHAGLPRQGGGSDPAHVGLAHLRDGLHSPFCRPPWFSPCAPWPGRHPGCGYSYMCPAQASSTRNPPVAPEMCQPGLRTMPSWVERAAALTQTHLGQEPHFQWL